MKYFSIIVFFIMLYVNLFAEVQVKVKNICIIDGYKYNQVYGYGLVAGLPGTGDSKAALAADSIKNLLRTLGIENDKPVMKNIAAVLVTAQLYPHTRIGDRVDVVISSIGDAKSLDGGFLIQSPLKGADGKTYVVAQGKLESPSDSSAGIGKGITVSRISNGGIIENEIQPKYIFEDNNKNRFIRLILKKWDYANADKISKSIKKIYPDINALVQGDGKIVVPVKNDVPISEFISKIQNIEITPEIRARIVIDQKNGVIVSGGNVIVSESLVSRKGMTIEIEGTGKKKHTAFIKDSTTVKDIVDILNAIGADTDDTIAIIKALKDSGALHAELILK